MPIKTTRLCLYCGKSYIALSAKKFLCGERSCYRYWHIDRQALDLSITEYKDLCKNKKLEDLSTSPQEQQ
mgnify:CR=1 FL=1